jgi:integrase
LFYWSGRRDSNPRPRPWQVWDLLLDRVADKHGPHAANSCHAVLSGLFNFVLGRDIVETTPMLGVKKPTKYEESERYLNDTEIKTVWQACDDSKVSPIFGALVRLLLLTGARRNQVAQMQWDELDFDNRLWHIPGARTKNGEADDARAVIEYVHNNSVPAGE